MENQKTNLSDRIFILLVILVIGLLIYFGGNLYDNLFPKQYFSVDGEGKVFAVPDVAVLRIGVQTEGREVNQVVNENNEKMNNILKEIKNLGIDEKDIKTVNYSLNPQYDYFEGKRIFRGYLLNQEVQVKIRDFQKIGEVISKATNLGANIIGDLNFQVDDIEKYKDEARKIAIEKAKQKAEQIAKISGLRLRRLVNVTETFGYPIPFKAEFGATEMSLPSVSVQPQIQPGQQEITVNIVLTYEVR